MTKDHHISHNIILEDWYILKTSKWSLDLHIIALCTDKKQTLCIRCEVLHCLNNSNSTFIALNLCQRADSKAQRQDKIPATKNDYPKIVAPNFHSVTCIQLFKKSKLFCILQDPLGDGLLFVREFYRSLHRSWWDGPSSLSPTAVSYDGSAGK